MNRIGGKVCPQQPKSPQPGGGKPPTVAEPPHVHFSEVLQHSRQQGKQLRYSPFRAAKTKASLHMCGAMVESLSEPPGLDFASRIVLHHQRLREVFQAFVPVVLDILAVLASSPFHH